MVQLKCLFFDQCRHDIIKMLIISTKNWFFPAFVIEDILDWRLWILTMLEMLILCNSHKSCIYLFILISVTFLDNIHRKKNERSQYFPRQ